MVGNRASLFPHLKQSRKYHGECRISRSRCYGVSHGWASAKTGAPGHCLQPYFLQAEAWAAEFGGRCCATPAQAAEGQDIVFACVGNDDDLRQVVLGEEGAVHSMAPGSIFVDHTTASCDVARELAVLLAEKDIAFMDAPVSGGQAGAENGVLTIMAGGSEAVFARVKPVMAAYARCAELLGDVGAGQLTKMVNQICIAGVVQGLAEAMHFAKSAGLDGEKVVEVISKGAAQSWQMENRHKTMLKGEYDLDLRWTGCAKT